MSFLKALGLELAVKDIINESGIFEDVPENKQDAFTKQPDSVPSTAVGQLVDPKKFNPDDPEILVSGFGTYTRSALQLAILNRLKGIYKVASQAAKSDPETAYRLYNNIRILLDPKTGVVPRLVQAHIDAANQLDNIRAKGGRRDVIIPKQK